MCNFWSFFQRPRFMPKSCKYDNFEHLGLPESRKLPHESQNRSISTPIGRKRVYLQLVCLFPMIKCRAQLNTTILKIGLQLGTAAGLAKTSAPNLPVNSVLQPHPNVVQGASLRVAPTESPPPPPIHIRNANVIDLLVCERGT